MYVQTDGVAMGSPLGPSLANFFLSHVETSSLDLSLTFAPVTYRRYVDDTFLAFKDPSHVQECLEYFNYLCELEFTCDLAVDYKLPFVGVTIDNSSSSLAFSVYRKKEIQLPNVKSHLWSKFKFSAIHALVNRAIRLSSSLVVLQKELDLIRDMAKSCGLSVSRVDKIISQQSGRVKPLCKVLEHEGDGSPPVSVSSEVDSSQDRPSFVKLPYINNVRVRALSDLLRGSNIRPIFVSPCNLYWFVRVKESRIPSKLGLALVIYRYVCHSCGNDYIGHTERVLSARTGEHVCVNSQLSNAHRELCSTATPVLRSDFEVFDTGRTLLDVKIKEAVYIRVLYPTLNRKIEGRHFKLRL